MTDSPTTEQISVTTDDVPTTLNLDGPTVAVKVDKKLYHVHEALVANASVFFANVLKPEWRRDASLPIDLSEESKEAFKGFMQWLYTSKLPDQHPDKDINHRLAKLYVLGEKLQATEFQNAVLAALIAGSRAHKWAAGILTIRLIYSRTISNSPARRLMADMCAFSIHLKAVRLEHLDPEEDGEFMRDLIVAMTKYREVPNGSVEKPWIASPDTYLLNVKKE